MSEFVLNTEGTGADWESLDAFTQGFIEAAFFSEVSTLDPSDFFQQEEPNDGSVPCIAGPAEIDRDSFCRIKDFCDEFQKRAAAVLQEAYESDYDESQAGRDLYFTRAGHGVGYWSRDELSRPRDPEEVKRLQAIMRAESTTPAEWSRLNDQVKALKEDIGARLSELAGRGEINLDAYEDESHSSGFQVYFYIS
jgi:hypothetical protein